MGPGLLLLALFFPIYRSECFLGFVIGMSYTSGVILPTGFGIAVDVQCDATLHQEHLMWSI